MYNADIAEFFILIFHLFFTLSWIFVFCLFLISWVGKSVTLDDMVIDEQMRANYRDPDSKNPRIVPMVFTMHWYYIPTIKKWLSCKMLLI